MKTGGGGLREGVSGRDRAIQAYDRRDPIRLMCRARAISPADYDAGRARPERARGAGNRALVVTT